MPSETKLNADTNTRLFYISWLRGLLLILVVAHHAGQAYGPTGGDWPVKDVASSNFLGVFFSFNAAFFMGFFFLLSGYFVPGAVERKGCYIFLKDRLIRLGIPLVLFSVFAFGTVAYFNSDQSKSYLEFLTFDYIGGGEIMLGHLWFLAHLLLYSLLYLLVRVTGLDKQLDKSEFHPAKYCILIFVLLLGFSGGLIRIYYPQDTWISLFGILPIEPAHLPQYLSLFFIGIWCGKYNWFERLKLPSSIVWGLVGLVAFAAMRNVSYLPSRLSDFIDSQFLYGFLEAFACVGLIVFFLGLARELFARKNTLVEWFSAQSYGVYVLHVFNVVGLQMALLDVEFPALTKFVIVTLGALFSSTLSIALLRLIPFVRRVI